MVPGNPLARAGAARRFCPICSDTIQPIAFLHPPAQRSGYAPRTRRFCRAQLPHGGREGQRPQGNQAKLLRILGYLRPYWPQFLLVPWLSSERRGLALHHHRSHVDQAPVGNDLGFLIQLLLIALAAMLASQLIGVAENYINS